MRAFVPALALAALILGGCVEYRESLVLERDGSGTVAMAIGVNETLLRAAEVADSAIHDPAAALAAIEAQHGLRVIESRAETREGTRWVHLVLTFDSLADLNGIDRIEPYQGQFGNIALTESSAGRRVLARTVHPALPEKVEQSFLSPLLVPMFTGYSWSYEVRLPARVLESNGETVTGPDGDANVVRWSFDLGDLVDEPRVMEATIARTGVGPAGIGVGMALMVLGILAVRLMQRRRRHAVDS